MGLRDRISQLFAREPVALAVLMMCLYFALWPLLTLFSEVFSSPPSFAGPPPWYFLAIGGLLVVYLGYQLSFGSASRAENVVTAVLVISLYLVVVPFAGRRYGGYPGLLPAPPWYFAAAGLPILAYAVYRGRWRSLSARRRLRGGK